MEILNLTSKSRTKRLWDVGFIELAERDRLMVADIVNNKGSESCFTLPYLRLISEIVSEYDTPVIYIEDELNKPGVVEMINDLGKVVVLQSDLERAIVRTTPIGHG